MKSHLMCAIGFGILFTFLILSIPLFLIYAHLEQLNLESSLMEDFELSNITGGPENDFSRLTQLASLDEMMKFIEGTTGDPCPSYQFSCGPSNADEDRMCIDRKHQCDSKLDCPLGEDEDDCVDVSKVIGKNYYIIHEKLNASSVPPDLHIKPAAITPDDLNSTDSSIDWSDGNWTGVTMSPEVVTEVDRDSLKHPNHPYSDCTFAEILEGTCTPCNFSHNTSVICKGYGLDHVPRDLQPSIKILNLDNNEIKIIDELTINLYSELIVLSIRSNNLTHLPSGVFYNLAKIRRFLARPLHLMKEPKSTSFNKGIKLIHSLRYLGNNQITHIDMDAFSGLKSLKKLYLAFNRIQTVNFTSLRHTPQLDLLDLSDNQLSTLNQFPPLNQLEWLDLERNAITELNCETESPFRYLPIIKMLSLKYNRLQRIPSGCFNFSSQLVEIDLGHNLIESIDGEAFNGLTHLSMLSLDQNRIRELPVGVFRPLISLWSLNLTGAQIININRHMFKFNSNLTHLYFSRFRYCMYAPKVRLCRPFSDGLSSIHHLLVHPILRKSVWAVALFTCTGNLLVIIWRSISSKEDQVLSLFVQNLSVSDFLMGVYLMTIASYDYVYKDKYSLHALDWTRSWQCSFCGVLAMISSELSVLVLTLITIERYKCITAEFRVVTASSAKVNLLLTWFISISLAIFPLIYWKGEPYYGSSSGLCFPLHINEPFNLGWQYSAFVIIGINLTAVIVIAILYWRMFSIIKSDRKFARPALPSEKKKREDAILAFRFFAIVVTDCLCWFPIATIKLIAFTSVTISPTLNAWLVVFILPINSALNPVIYTLAAPTELHHRLYKQFRRLIISFKETFLHSTSTQETFNGACGDVNNGSNNGFGRLSRSPSSCTTTTTGGGTNSGNSMSLTVPLTSSASTNFTGSSTDTATLSNNYQNFTSTSKYQLDKSMVKIKLSSSILSSSTSPKVSFTSDIENEDEDENNGDADDYEEEDKSFHLTSSNSDVKKDKVFSSSFTFARINNGNQVTSSAPHSILNVPIVINSPNEPSNSQIEITPININQLSKIQPNLHTLKDCSRASTRVLVSDASATEVPRDGEDEERGGGGGQEVQEVTGQRGHRKKDADDSFEDEDVVCLPIHLNHKMDCTSRRPMSQIEYAYGNNCHPCPGDVDDEDGNKFHNSCNHSSSSVQISQAHLAKLIFGRQQQQQQKTSSLHPHHLNQNNQEQILSLFHHGSHDKSDPVDGASVTINNVDHLPSRSMHHVVLCDGSNDKSTTNQLMTGDSNDLNIKCDSIISSTMGKVLNVLTGSKKIQSKLINSDSNDSTDSGNSGQSNALLLTSMSSVQSSCCYTDDSICNCIALGHSRAKMVPISPVNYIRPTSKSQLDPLLPRRSSQLSDCHRRNLFRTSFSNRKRATSLVNGNYDILLPSTSVSSQESQLSTESICGQGKSEFKWRQMISNTPPATETTTMTTKTTSTTTTTTNSASTRYQNDCEEKLSSMCDLNDNSIQVQLTQRSHFGGIECQADSQF